MYAWNYVVPWHHTYSGYATVHRLHCRGPDSKREVGCPAYGRTHGPHVYFDTFLAFLQLHIL